MAGESIEYELCAALLVPLARALRCTPEGCPPEVRVNLGPIEDNACSSLAVTIVEVQTRRAGSPAQFFELVDDTTSREGTSVWLSLQVTLTRPCWPTVTVRLADGDFTESESIGERTEQATASLLVDGRVLHAALLDALENQDVTFGDLFGWDPSLAWTLGNRQVLREGPCAGWSFPVTLEVGAFCEFEVCDAPVQSEPPVRTSETPTEAAPLGSVDVRPRWQQ